MENTLSCNPNQAKKNIIRCIKAGLVPFIQSSPGTGKSSIVRQIASEFNLKLIDHRLSTSDPTDLLGLPHFEEGQAVFSPFRDVFPLEDSPLPQGKDGFLLFLDEFNSAPRSVQAAAYKLILDRQVGQHTLHKRCVIVCAGNKLDDNAITVNLSTAMQSRLVHIIMETDYNSWLQNVAIPESYDERIVAFLSMYPNFLMDFEPEKTELTFACPRTWEFVNKLIKKEPELEATEWLPLLSGTIASGVAMNFLNFCKFRNDMISIQDVLKNPEKALVPELNEAKWATLFHILSNVTEDNFNDIVDYVERYPADFRIIFYRSLYIKHPEWSSHPAFVKARTSIGELLE